jgi:uncharacterized protein (DUF488 family)
MVKIVTLGAHGADEDTFFKALTDAGVDTFCDLRLRRGMRGSAYAFANSARLQRRLAEMGIRYLYFKDLAPSQAMREQQHQTDKRNGVGSRSRDRLGEVFVEAYTAERLRDFDAAHFIAGLGEAANVVALFCVERAPDACHRSLVARRIQQDLGLVVEHLQP